MTRKTFYLRRTKYNSIKYYNLFGTVQKIHIPMGPLNIYVESLNNNRNNIIHVLSRTTTCLQRTSSENIVNTVFSQRRYISFPVCIAYKFYGNTGRHNRPRGGLIIYLSVSPRERRLYLNAAVVSRLERDPKTRTQHSRVL